MSFLFFGYYNLITSQNISCYLGSEAGSDNRRWELLRLQLPSARRQAQW